MVEGYFGAGIWMVGSRELRAHFLAPGTCVVANRSTFRQRVTCCAFV